MDGYDACPVSESRRVCRAWAETTERSENTFTGGIDERWNGNVSQGLVGDRWWVGKQNARFEHAAAEAMETGSLWERAKWRNRRIQRSNLRQ